MTRGLPALAGAALFALAATVFVTWPQAQLLSTHLAAHHDAQFSIWRLGWIAHALATSPRHLFDANIFHPAAGTLAYSDATLLEGLLGAPLFWAGLPPALVYNVLLLAGFGGSGLGMFVLARHLTRATGPALVAAAIYTMLPYRIEHFMHLELQWAMFIPLAFWALHRATTDVSWKWGVLAGVFLWLQLLACVYYGVFLALTLIVFAPLLLVGHRDRWPARGVALGAAALVALALSIPFLLPYVSAAGALGTRTAEDIARYSARPENYFAASSTSWVWGWTADRWGDTERRLFPGGVALLLAVAAAWRRPARQVVVYGVVAALAIELSFGTNGVLYRTLLAPVTLLQGFRAFARFAVVASCAVAVLAAFGVEAVRTRMAEGSRARRLAVPLVLLLMAVEYANRPMWIGPADPVAAPDVYRVIRGAAPGAVIELPLPDLNRLPGLDPSYEAWSLWHWKPLVNGYSGYHPRDYIDTILRMLSFPDEASIGRLRGHDVRYVVVHRSYYDQDQYAALMLRLAQRPEFKPWGAYRDLTGMADIFELLPVD